MSTIPASYLVEIIPGVLNAGGNALELIGLVLDNNPRIPVGAILAFPPGSPLNSQVAAYFGGASLEATHAAVYFTGFDNASAQPASMLFTNYPAAGASAWLRSAPVTGYTIPQLAALSGALSIVVDGYTYSDGSLSLSGATSYSAAAGLIQTGLNGTLQAAATCPTSTIAAETASCTATINGNVMTVSGSVTGVLYPGAALSGTGVASGTTIVNQLSGTTGGDGTYAVSGAQQIVASTTVTAAYGLLTIGTVSSGTISVGQTITEASAGSLISANIAGSGAGSTWVVNKSQTVGSATLHMTAPPLVVAFDSVSGGFTITSENVGGYSTAAFASGALATSLFMTAATGAVISQGSAAPTPGAFMNNIIATTQNWATFYTMFDPDGGAAGGNTQKQAFAAWVNQTTDQYAYICIDMDPTPTLSNDATTSMGQILAAAQSDGTFLMYEPAPGGFHYAPMIAGWTASINFTAPNGRITYDMKHQAGQVASVTNITVAENLDANGYNHYDAIATRAQNFVGLNKGVVSGKFQWFDTYINQIQLNAALQQALVDLLSTINSLPYNTKGYGLIQAACLDPIQAALLFGSIQPGITLSNAQIAEINNRANAQVASVIAAQGWFLQILNAAPQVRQARTSPPMTLWYTDGESVQQITLNSIVVQ